MSDGKFFLSWALWQKMTFVLAGAIVVVVGVAYCKLLWTNRYLKKHRIIDEEKQARIRELRLSGQLVEDPKESVPFGVRAIQSGIQVDGIWISNANTPVPSELNFSLKDSSSGSLSERESSRSVNASSGRPSIASSVGTIAPPRPKSEVQFRDRVNGSAFIEHTESLQSLERSSRKSYQPRRSSGLRYHDIRSHREATLADLESGASHPMLQRNSHPPRVSSMINSFPYSGQDNALISRSSSDSDDERLELKGKGKGKAREYMAVEQDDPTEFTLKSTDSYKSPMSDQIGDRLGSNIRQQEQNEYSEAPMSPTNTRNNIQKLSTSRSYSPSPFIPGELHQNKVVRKVNSGFEVLPAGTFHMPRIDKKEGNTTEKSTSRSEDSVGPRGGRRLQKKRRESTISTHSSKLHDP